MTFYLKGLLVSLGGVAFFYVALRFLFPLVMSTKAGQVTYFLIYAAFHDVHAPLRATVGGNPSLFGQVEFWLWSMIIFASTFLIYLRVMSGRPLN